MSGELLLCDAHLVDLDPPNVERGDLRIRDGLIVERGPELVNLPRGSQVYPNHKLPDGGGTQEVAVRLVGGGLTLSDGGQIVSTISAEIDRSSALTERRTLAKTPGYLEEQRMRSGRG